VSIASQLVGVNMGFQAATLFSPTSGMQESSYAVFKSWIMTLCILSFQLHHTYIQEIFSSFQSLPLGGSSSFGEIANSAASIVQSSFLLGIRLGAPLLLVQFLVTLGLGLVNRSVPQLNALVMQFPLSFVVSFFVLFFTSAAFVKLIGTQGVLMSAKGMNDMTHSLGKH
jgi:flagellar biosynthesis protein FliR